MANTKLSYAEAMAEVERILEEIDSRQTDVDELAARVRRATELLAQCKKSLYKAEQDVEKILGQEP